MKFYKSFLFLLSLNLLFILPVYFFLNLRFLIPVFVFSILFDLFLLFFSGFYLKKKFLFSPFPPQDSYGVHLIFENLKKSFDFKNVQLLKIKKIKPAFFCFSYGKVYFVALSEDLLEKLSQEEVKCLLSYPFQMIKSGDVVFLTLLSGFLFLIDKIVYFLTYPFFKKASTQKENLFLVLILKIISFITKRIFYNTDKILSFKDKEKQALLLWKIHSLSKVTPPKISLFFAPLFLTNPLTNSNWECYISLQPSIKGRVETLIGFYPP